MPSNLYPRPSLKMPQITSQKTRKISPSSSGLCFYGNKGFFDQTAATRINWCSGLLFRSKICKNIGANCLRLLAIKTIQMLWFS
jgi:hypothetical protein